MQRPVYPYERIWLERFCHAKQLLDDAEHVLQPDFDPSFSFAHVKKLTARLRTQVIHGVPIAIDQNRDQHFFSYPLLPIGDCIASKVALHEAGHFVVMESVTKPGGVVAASVGRRKCGGLTMFSGFYLEVWKDQLHIPRLAFIAAGHLAELIAHGKTLEGLLNYGPSDDWDQATAFLEEAKIPSSAIRKAHIHTQKYALQTLINKWDRVHEVAQALLEHGCYSAVVGDEAPAAKAIQACVN